MTTGWTIASTVLAALVVGTTAGLVSRRWSPPLRRISCPRDVDHRELETGIKVEMEHTDDPAVAKIIACGHLSPEEGIPDYYTRLLKMEHQAKRRLARTSAGGGLHAWQ